MAIQHSFRIAGGTARVAQRRGSLFVELGPDILFGRRLDPRLVTHETGNSGIRGQSVAIAESDPVLDRRALRSDRAHDRQERQIEADDSIFRIVDDPGDLIGRQPRIDGVQHASTAANPVVQLEMSIAVPGQSRHPLAAVYTQ
jgi:hypothetical protein